MTHSEWLAEGTRRFGEDKMQWRFVCPSCGYVARVQDWRSAGATEGQVAYSCIGRALGSAKELGDTTGGPCNYAGGGLFRLNPVRVTFPGGEVMDVFAFAGVAAC